MDDSIVLQHRGACGSKNQSNTVHCAEDMVGGSGGKERGRTNEPRRSNQCPPTLEIQAVLPHHRWPNVSSDWPPIQPRCLLWAEPRAVVSVGVFRKSAQGILCKVEAPTPLATDRVLVKVAAGWRLSGERVSRWIGQTSVSELSPFLDCAVDEVPEDN